MLSPAALGGQSMPAAWTTSLGMASKGLPQNQVFVQGSYHSPTRKGNVKSLLPTPSHDCSCCLDLSLQFSTKGRVKLKVGRNRQSFISNMPQLLSAVQLQELGGRRKRNQEGFVVNCEYANMVKERAGRMAEIMTL